MLVGEYILDGEVLVVVDEDDDGLVDDGVRNGAEGEDEVVVDEVVEDEAEAGGAVEAVDDDPREDAGGVAGAVEVVVEAAGSGAAEPRTASARRSSNIRAASVVRNTTDWPAVVPTRPGATTLVALGFFRATLLAAVTGGVVR